MADPNLFPPLPTPEGQVPLAEVVESQPGINPFAGGQVIEQPMGTLALGGGMDSLNLPVGIAQEDQPRQDVEQIAKKACGLIANMLIDEGDPDRIQFPSCADMRVVSSSLNQLVDTALGLGFGPFSPNIMKAWTRFMHETTNNYRHENNLEPSDLVPLTVELPDWLNSNPNFDILPNCRLMDITIIGDVRSTIAWGTQHCRINFKDTVHREAVVCNSARRCTVIFQSAMNSLQSFINAENISIHLERDQSGRLGPMKTSRVECKGSFNGWFTMRGTGCVHTENVRANTQA